MRKSVSCSGNSTKQTQVGTGQLSTASHWPGRQRASVHCFQGDLSANLHSSLTNTDALIGNLARVTGFPGGSASKESACNAGDLGSIPGMEDPLEKGTGTHSSVLAWKFHGLCSPWRRKELERTERLSLSDLLSVLISRSISFFFYGWVPSIPL